MANARYAEILADVITAVEEVPVENVIGRYVELQPRGNYLLGLCPFHPDHHLGSFVVTPSKNIWRCFAEGIGGNGIRFEMMYNELRFIPAVLKLALEFGIISLSEYTELSGKRFTPTVIRKAQRVLETTEQVKADPLVCHNVYEAMLNVLSLSDAHRQHLLQTRQLEEDDLKDYFTMPISSMKLSEKIWACLTDTQAQRLYQRKYKQCSQSERQHIDRTLQSIRQQFKLVPGFYYDTESGRHRFVSYKGIGFAVRDADGRIQGIQIRRDKVKTKTQSRYIWFSSGFMTGEDHIQGGASPGAPGGVIYPKRTGSNCLCITEGRFKAEQIAKCGNTAIYVSGVSSWKAIMPIIRQLAGRMEAKKAFLIFDADLLGNAAVHSQLSALASALIDEGLTPVLAIWNICHGKGFDDLLIDQGTEYVKYINYLTYPDFEQTWQKTLQDVLQRYHVKRLRDVSKETAEKFTSDLQEAMAESFKLK